MGRRNYLTITKNCEDSSNIGFIHEACAEERKNKTQENLEQKLRKALDSKKTTFVKKCFSYQDKNEHMWVEVSNMNFTDKIIDGTLNNDPVYIMDIKCDDKVTLRFDEVEEIIY